MNDLAASSGTDWLPRFLEHVGQSKVCTAFGCTTCGSKPFLSKLLLAMPTVSRMGGPPIWNHQATSSVLTALRALHPPSHYPFALVEPVSLILCAIHYRIPMPVAEMEMALHWSWAGQRLEEMKRHHEVLERHRAEQRAFMAPLSVAKRREEKRAAGASRHQTRAAFHQERGRKWLQLRDAAAATQEPY